MQCCECFHDLVYFPHICLIHTCSACFSEKSIFSMYCEECKMSLPCSFCQKPGKFNVDLKPNTPDKLEPNYKPVCLMHMTRLCSIDKAIRHNNRLIQNQHYDDQIKAQKARKLGRPRLAKSRGF